MEYFFIVAFLLIPGGEKDSTNFTAVPFQTMQECRTFLEDPTNEQMLTGSLRQYLRYKYGNMSVAITIDGMECRPESELEWNIPETPKSPVLLKVNQ